MSNRYFLLNKPQGLVSQFKSSQDVKLLQEIDFDFPSGTHAIGRLDRDSEGLLILTTDKRITKLLFMSKHAHLRKYLVMVQHHVNPEKLEELKNGVEIRINETEYYKATPIHAEIVKDPRSIYPFAADVRENYPHTWLLITMAEGKFRQVRKMVVAIGHRCQRLIRISIAGLYISDIRPGQIKELSSQEFFKCLGMDDTL